MTEKEWDSHADRIGDLWPSPRMSPGARGAYYDELARYPSLDVRDAIAALASTHTGSRPSVALIVQTIGKLYADRPQPAKADGEPLSLEQHVYAMVAIKRPHSPEHRRRFDAVMDAPRRLSVAELGAIGMSLRDGPAAEFDERLEQLLRMPASSP